MKVAAQRYVQLLLHTISANWLTEEREESEVVLSLLNKLEQIQSPLKEEIFVATILRLSKRGVSKS